MSRNEDLLSALLNDEPVDFEPLSRAETYLKACCEKCGCEGLPKPVSRNDVLLYALAEKIAQGGGDVTIKRLDVTENGTYRETGKAYSPVVVNVPQIETDTLNVSANGTYTAEDGEAYDEVVVNVPNPSTGSISITENGTVDVTDYASASVAVPQGLPIEVSTAEGMSAVLIEANAGKAYKFTGTTDSTYTNGDIYVVEVGE